MFLLKSLYINDILNITSYWFASKKYKHELNFNRASATFKLAHNEDI